MAYGYWKLGRADIESVFHLFYRTPPFGGEFAVAAGLQGIIDAVENFSFSEEDCDYLRTLKDPAGSQAFEADFLDYLHELKLELDIDCVPEGTVVYPQEPLVRVQGPLLQAQIVETLLLNRVNFPSLIATKAARLRSVAGDDEIIEFGLRRAQGGEAGNIAARSAFVGGADSTSNVMAGKRYGIPVRGTHAHSWIMSFDTEKEAFDAWAEAHPNSGIFLVDTFDTLEGVKHAIKASDKILGIRLDSGDLLSLSIEARKILDEAGHTEAFIVASNELDEEKIGALKVGGSPISVWGVGTRLTTGHPDGALDGVYKLGAVRNDDETWGYRAKRSDDLAKATPPGILQVRRYKDREGHPIGDVIVDLDADTGPNCEAICGEETVKFEDDSFDELLVPIFCEGKLVYQSPPLHEMRQYVMDQVKRTAAGYFVGTEVGLNKIKMALIG